MKESIKNISACNHDLKKILFAYQEEKGTSLIYSIYQKPTQYLLSKLLSNIILKVQANALKHSKINN